MRIAKLLAIPAILFVVIALVLAGCEGQKENSIVSSSSQIASSLTKTEGNIKLDVPTVSCGGSTSTTITVIVTAGASGAAGGFSLQWISAEDYAALNTSTDWSSAASYCAASFSGNASGSIYNLAAGGSASVVVGAPYTENGASGCVPIFDCDQTWVFRAFAHTYNTGTGKNTVTYGASDKSAGTACSTDPCGDRSCATCGCTYTQGYYKRFGPVAPGNSPVDNRWALTNIVLGTVSYTQNQALDILKTAVKGNGYVMLAHQLIAAKLNIAGSGTTPPQAVADAIAAADAFIGGSVIPTSVCATSAPVGAPWNTVSGLAGVLGSFNEGSFPDWPHCSE